MRRYSARSRLPLPLLLNLDLRLTLPLDVHLRLALLLHVHLRLSLLHRHLRLRLLHRDLRRWLLDGHLRLRLVYGDLRCRLLHGHLGCPLLDRDLRASRAGCGGIASVAHATVQLGQCIRCLADLGRGLLLVRLLPLDRVLRLGQLLLRLLVGILALHLGWHLAERLLRLCYRLANRLQVRLLPALAAAGQLLLRLAQTLLGLLQLLRYLRLPGLRSALVRRPGWILAAPGLPLGHCRSEPGSSPVLSS